MNPSPLLLLRAALALAPAAAFAQGALAPSDPPAPSMKSLGDIAAAIAAKPTDGRIVLSAATAPGSADSTFVIGTPGSYVLSGPVAATPGKHGIRIGVPNVSLDLNGFTVSGGGSGVVPIFVTSSCARISNGAVESTTAGVSVATPGVVVLADLRVSAGAGFSCVSATSALAVLATNAVTRGGNSGVLVNSAAAAVVADCAAGDLAGAGSGTGLSGSVVRDGAVSGAALPGGFTGVSALAAARVTVSSATGGGPRAGIKSRVVRDAVVTGLGDATSTGSAVGIDTSVATGCAVNGVTASGAAAVGLRGVVTAGASVQNVAASGAFRAYGIDSTLTRDSVVGAVSSPGDTSAGVRGRHVVSTAVSGVTPGNARGYGILIEAAPVMIVGNSVQGVGGQGVGNETSPQGAGAQFLRNTVRDFGTNVSGAGPQGAGILSQVAGARLVGNTVHGGPLSSIGFSISSQVAGTSYLYGNRAEGAFSVAAFSLSSGVIAGPLVGTYAANGEITSTGPFDNHQN